MVCGLGEVGDFYRKCWYGEPMFDEPQLVPPQREMRLRSNETDTFAKRLLRTALLCAKTICYGANFLITQ